MCKHRKEKDEHLERLWNMKEYKEDSIHDLKNALGEEYNDDILNQLASEGLVFINKETDKISLTKEGEKYARQVIRAHRIAERMLYDVMGGDFEIGACEFEHTITPELVDSICTLLGHPRQCPHGMPIPEGECCKTSARIAHSSVIPVTEMQIGQSAKVAYLHSKNDQQLHKIDGLHIRPGATIKLHQNYPTYVIECENMNVAIDEEVANDIYVWRNRDEYKNTYLAADDTKKENINIKKRRFKFRFGLKRKK